MSHCYKRTEPVTHELKTDKRVFTATRDWSLRCNLRKNDRGYQVNDFLLLLETEYSGDEMKLGAPLKYTGRSMVVKVTHILYGPFYGLPTGWCILSFIEWDVVADGTKTFIGDNL